MVRKILLMDMEKCTGCRACVIACSFVKKKVFSLIKSRIWILKIEDKCLAIPIVCEQCEDPPCMIVCPVRAIAIDPEIGRVMINSELCIGCKECIWVCPFGAIRLDPDKKIAVKCDLCDGDPECVKVCMPGALQYVRADRPLILKKWEYAERRIKALVSKM